MTIRDFLDAGYALLVDAYQSVGMDLITAMENVDQAIGMPQATSENDVASDVVSTATDNDRALRELAEMMGGVGA